MSSVDGTIIAFFNQFAHRSWTFDSLVVLLSTSYLFKGGLFMALLWWGWFQGGEAHLEHRRSFLSTLLAAYIAVLVARGIAFALPFRVRPMHNLALAFVLPYAMNPSRLLEWSSFPSDTSALFMALATGLLYFSRLLGILAMVYVSIFTCVVRVYLGIHYPTDVAVGAFIGSMTVFVAHIEVIQKRMLYYPWQWLRKKPGMVYAGLFLISQQVALIEDLQNTHDLLHLVMKEIIKLYHLGV